MVIHSTAGGTNDVVYTLESSSTLTGTWSSLVIDGTNSTTTIQTDGTEIVRIVDLESAPITNLPGQGFVRMRATIGATSEPTEVLGWTETNLNKTCGTFNNPYLRCASFSGKVDNPNTTGQTLNFVTSVGPTLDLRSVIVGPNPGDTYTQYIANSYYLEVTSGTNIGHRFDIESATATSVVLATDGSLFAAAAPFNTLTTVPNLAGESVIIRRHWTLGVQFPVSTSPATGFAADTTPTINNAADADQVQIFANGAWTTYYVYDADGATVTESPKWVVLPPSGFDGTNRTSIVLPPGQGMFVSRPVSTIQVLSYGEVRDCAFIRPLQTGNNLVGGGFPVLQSANDSTPTPYSSDREMARGATTVGFFGSRDFKTADSFFTWRGDEAVSPAVTTEGYDTYYLVDAPDPDGGGSLAAILQWVKMGEPSLPQKDDALLFKSDRSVFIRSKDGIPLYTIPCPWRANPYPLAP